jgi:hypothetical protein
MPNTTNAAPKGVIGKLLEIQTTGFEGLTKDSTNPHFRNTYISLGKLLDVVLPVLNAHGLLLVQTPSGDDAGVPTLKTSIIDAETQETIEGEVPLMLEKDNPQGLGSAITYARRYALMSMLGIVADEDDDGNKASPVRPAREVVNAPSKREKTREVLF